MTPLRVRKCITAIPIEQLVELNRLRRNRIGSSLQLILQAVACFWAPQVFGQRPRLYHVRHI
jgi:hypothetical protein